MHNINKMVFVGTEPWHGLGVKLPRNATYTEIAELAGFYKVIELPVLVPPLTEPVPDKKALLRADDLRLLSIVNSTYRVVQFAEVAETLVDAANMVGGFFHTAGTAALRDCSHSFEARVHHRLRVHHRPLETSRLRRYMRCSTARS